ncbi:MAG: hypothetical protein KJ749_08150, partial [Planctomycetes bacterium]|nr:hypothetical protein [Planctomycetota bacterium]
MRIRWRRSCAKPRAQDHNTEIEEIVRVVAEQLQAGQVVDYAAIESQHPDLQPELGNRLRRLRAIEEAADKAKHRPETGVPTGQPPTPLQDDLAFLSEALESYDIIEPIEYGGQGVVYRAIQRSTKRPVAIKLLLDGPLATDRQRHRFAREIELVSRLQHPNI